jgi:ligand-binding sensor domain-containing protein/signal transduction histidine kinase
MLPYDPLMFSNRTSPPGSALQSRAIGVLASGVLFLAGSRGLAGPDSAGWSPPWVQYGPRVWETEDGLPNNRVNALAQTTDGYLWVGTHDGLARFDGTEFTVYKAGNGSALTRNSIRALCASRDGSLYIGTEDGLVMLKDGGFSRMDTIDGLAGNTVTALCQSKEGAIWIGTTAGLSRYENGAFTNYTMHDGLLFDVIRSVFEDRSGALWVTTPQGLNCLRNGAVERFTTNNGLPELSVRSVCQDADGALWISSDLGLAKYDGRQFAAYDLHDNYSRNYIPAVCADSQGNLWIGTYNGLRRFYQEKFHTEISSTGAPYDQINTLLEDREGNIWAGSREGLIRLTRQRVSVYDVTSGLSLNNVMAVLQDRRDGRLWAGTWGGGLNRIPGGRVHIYGLTNSAPDALVLSLCQGADGGLWIGMDFDGGITQLKDNGRFRRITVNQGLPPAAAKVLLEDHAGRLWIGTSSGLYCSSGGKVEDQGVKNKFFRSVVHAMCETGQGGIWIGADAGLGRLENGRLTLFSSENHAPQGPVSALAEDDGGSLWIATPRKGLFRYHARKFTSYSRDQGLPGSEIFELLDDGAGSLWMSTDDGIFRIAKRDLDALDQNPQRSIIAIAYRRSDGLESTMGSNVGKPAAWKAKDGRLLFATTKGVAVIDPKLRQINHIIPPVYIEEVKADSEKVWPVSEAASEDSSPKFPPGRGEIEFSFAALSYTTPEKCRFRYKLEGLDTRWTPPDTKRTAKYINLAPGHYRFRVMACNGDGIWNETGAELAFNLQPHFWQTWWCQAAGALAVLATVAGVSRSVTQRRLRRRLELLEQQSALERERGRIARNIHDDLGSSLTRIMLLGTRTEQDLAENKEVAPYVRKIIDSCGATIQAMDEIVWAVNPENDTLDGLVAYLSQYTEEFFENTSIQGRFELPVESRSFALPAEVRHDLFLVVKEALHNVLKHSTASEVLVRVSAEGELVQIVIQDNGRGFDSRQETAGRKGNGLDNIRRRLQSHGGRLEITSNIGRGTKLSFFLRVKQKSVASPGDPPHVHRDGGPPSLD